MFGKFILQRLQNSFFLSIVSPARSAVKIESSKKFALPAVVIKNSHKNDSPCNIFAEYLTEKAVVFLQVI